MRSINRRLGAVIAALAMIGMTIAVPLAAGADSFEVSLPGEVETGPEGSRIFLRSFDVPPAFVGQLCTVTAVADNNTSVHPGNDIEVASENVVILEDVERVQNAITVADGVLELNASVSFTLLMGPDEIFSGGFDVTFDCQPPDEEIADPTWDVTPESLVCNPDTGEYEAQADGSITLNPFDDGSWDGETSFTGLSAGSYGPFTATADDGFVFASTQTDTFSTGDITVDSVGGDEPCDEVVTAVDPEIAQSQECEVEGTLTIPETEGVRYLLDGEEISAGVHSGPISGSLTAEALDGYELSNPDFSVEVEIAAAEDCPEQTTTTAPPTTEPPTTTTEPPTTTTEPEVEGSTTSTTQPETDEETEETLPFTGISTDGMAAAAALALVAGGGLVLLSRRSRESID